MITRFYGITVNNFVVVLLILHKYRAELIVFKQKITKNALIAVFFLLTTIKSGLLAV